MKYGDFDDDFGTPDNVVFKDQDDDDRIIDGYEINNGNKKRYNQNLLKNYPHTSRMREKSYFPLLKDFYNHPKPTIDRFHGKALKWLKWRGDQQQFYHEYLNYSPLMINVFVRKALEGIIWKNEFQPQDYDSHLILPTYHELRNKLKSNYAELDEHHFFDPHHR
jgi:hypothetical protein